MHTQTQEETFTLEEILTEVNGANRLILWNDDFNTFEHVTWCMVHYLDYTEKQGADIAEKVHTTGKCAVLEGTLPQLEVYRKILTQEGLTVTIQ